MFFWLITEEEKTLGDSSHKIVKDQKMSGHEKFSFGSISHIASDTLEHTYILFKMQFHSCLRVAHRIIPALWTRTFYEDLCWHDNQSLCCVKTAQISAYFAWAFIRRHVPELSPSDKAGCLAWNKSDPCAVDCKKKMVKNEDEKLEKFH